VTIVPTDGKPGVFAMLDVGAKNTVGLYFMYDVKQFDPAEWTSPAARGAHRGQAGLRQGNRRPRRREPEGPRGGVLAALHASAASSANAGESRARRRG
jgi:hypothetical protein